MSCIIFKDRQLTSNRKEEVGYENYKKKMKSSQIYEGGIIQAINKMKKPYAHRVE